MFVWKKGLIVKEDPTLHGSWESRRSEVHSLDLIEAMERQKNDVPTDIFSQGQEKPLARGQEKPLKISRQGRKEPVKNQTFRWSRQATKQVFASGKGCLKI